MLTTQEFQILFMGIIVGVVLCSSMVFTFLKKKDIDVPKVLETSQKVLESAQPIINFAKEIAPLNPVVNVATLIDKWAEIGVKNAQQMYHLSQLTGQEDRKNAAKETVCAALKELNIVPTESQNKLINDAIEAYVNDLGHKELTEAEKETEKQALKEQLTQAQAENATLKNTIAQIQNTVGVSQIVEPTAQQ